MNNSDMPINPIKGCDDKFFNFDVDMDKGYFDQGSITIGLTKREHFAGLAMQGVLSHSFGRGTNEELAVLVVSMADALLKELAK
jgi:hypothetical protein